MPMMVASRSVPMRHAHLSMVIRPRRRLAGRVPRVSTIVLRIIAAIRMHARSLLQLNRRRHVGVVVFNVVAGSDVYS